MFPVPPLPVVELVALEPPVVAELPMLPPLQAARRPAVVRAL
jgi:hypothetical protein